MLYRVKVFFLTVFYLIRAKTKIGKKHRRKVAKEIFSKAIREAGAGSVAIDCGANVGNIAGLFLEQGLQVHAFEPDPIAAGLLTEKHGKNTNLHFHFAAVGIKPGRQHLYRRKEFDENPEYWTISSSLLQRKVCDDNNSVEVDVIDLLDYIDRLPGSIAIMKMDIEGGEVEILEKILDSGLYRKIGLIFVETHERISLDCALRTAKIRARIHADKLENFNLDHN